MRRQIPQEPWSGSALWCRRVAIFAATVAVLSVLLARLHVLDPASSLASLGAAMGLSLIAMLLFGVSCVIIWNSGRRGMGASVAGAFISLLTLAYPSYLAYEAIRLPILSDISTDIDNPPYFSLTGVAYDARKGFQPSGIPQSARQAQRAAYPDVEPIVIDLDPDEAFSLILKTANALGWKLIDKRPPGGRSGEGHADFIDKSLILAIDEDVTIRLRPMPGQTRIDLRSASRYGRHDFGANAQRIIGFADELQTQLDSR